METTLHSLLVVEDDERTAAFLAENLRADGFRVATAARTGEAIRAIEVRSPELVLLDLLLAEGDDGLAVLDTIRAPESRAARIDPDLPVIVLSGRTGETDRVRGFARGADDYVPKPFSYQELLGRIRAVLRRSSARRRRGLVRVGALALDPLAHRVEIAGEPLPLSAKEFALLQVLASEPARVFTKRELLRDVWGYVAVGNTRTIDTHACRLRKKLAGAQGIRLETVRGVGYRLAPVQP